MRSRLYLLLKLFVLTMVLFVAQKLWFVLSADIPASWLECFSVMWHGIPLDLTTAGYTLVVPWLAVLLTWAAGEKGGCVRRWLMGYYAVMSLLFAIVFVADAALYPFWGFKIDSTIFLYTDKPRDALASVSGWFITKQVLLTVLFTLLYYGAYCFLLLRHRFRKATRPWVSWLVMLPVAGLLVVMIRGSLGKGTSNVTSAYFSENQSLNHAAVNPVFNLLYSLSHSQDFANEHQYFDEAKRQGLVDGIYFTESMELDTLLYTPRPNVILVVWEGCGASMVGAVGGNPQVTPCLNSLAAEGVLFSNCQSNSYRTDRGLVCILSGWLGFPATSLMKMPEKCESLPGIAKTLRKAGYQTDFWYGGDISFTNMGGFMLQNGFQRTYSEKDFSRNQRFSEWGVADGTLFDKVLENLRERGDADQPFFTTILTLTSHEPWTTPQQFLKDEIENSFAYTDHCLGKFVEGLKALPCWTNTVVVILPDHGVISREGQGRTSPEVIHIPIVMCGGAVRCHCNIDVLMNQSDLAATLLGQLGLPHDDFIFSRDVLSKSYVYPTAVHCSHDDITFFDSTGVSIYDFAAAKITGGTNGQNAELRAEKGKAILQTLFLDAASR